jgi:hypothetical protein
MGPANVFAVRDDATKVVVLVLFLSAGYDCGCDSSRCDPDNSRTKIGPPPSPELGSPEKEHRLHIVDTRGYAAMERVAAPAVV